MLKKEILNILNAGVELAEAFLSLMLDSGLGG